MTSHFNYQLVRQWGQLLASYADALRDRHATCLPLCSRREDCVMSPKNNCVGGETPGRGGLPSKKKQKKSEIFVGNSERSPTEVTKFSFVGMTWKVFHAYNIKAPILMQHITSCHIFFGAILQKCFTQIYRALYGNAMLVPFRGAPTWRP